MHFEDPQCNCGYPERGLNANFAAHNCLQIRFIDTVYLELAQAHTAW
jgi:hypothetical protein